MLFRHYISTLTLLILIKIQGHICPSLRRRQLIFPESGNNGRALCRTHHGGTGICILIPTCPSLANVRNIRILRRALCGFEGNNPLVCCPGRITSQTRPTTTTTTFRPYRPPPPPTRRPTAPPTRRTTPPRLPPQRPPPVSNNELFPSDCGKSLVTHTRIIGGEESALMAWPWMAALFIEENGIRSPSCGGALVNKKYVATAAHCLVRRDGTPIDPQDITVRLGDHDLYSENDGARPTNYDVERIIRHEQFNRNNFVNDIALLRMSRSVRYNSFVGPVCMPHVYPASKGMGFVTGWGTTAFRGPSSNVLMQVQVPIWDQDKCKSAYQSFIPVTDASMCAGYEEGGKDSCQGDSGGPLVVPENNRFTLMGIVSYGRRCALAGYPGVYTNVTMFMDWVRTKMV